MKAVKMMSGNLVQWRYKPPGNPTTFLYRINFKEKTDLMGNFQLKNGMFGGR